MVTSEKLTFYRFKMSQVEVDDADSDKDEDDEGHESWWVLLDFDCPSVSSRVHSVRINRIRA